MCLVLNYITLKQKETLKEDNKRQRWLSGRVREISCSIADRIMWASLGTKTMCVGFIWILPFPSTCNFPIRFEQSDLKALK